MGTYLSCCSLSAACDSRLLLPWSCGQGQQQDAAFSVLVSPQKYIDFVEPAVELEHRIDFELKEVLMESRYWSAVTSYTAYWSSMDITLFLLTFVCKHDQEHTDTSSLYTL
ncbi:hypothetical protein Q9233_014770 [Columba guinea]|nr:hypothetical protein Q9233_014770 [Columba guinea]